VLVIPTAESDGHRYHRGIVFSNPDLPWRARIFRLTLAWPLIALGIALLLVADLGVAPFDVLSTGVAHATGWPFTIAYLSVSLLFFGIGAALGGKVGPASVIGTFVIGPLITVFRDLLPDPTTWLARIAMVLLATLLLSTAVCLVITSELGAGPTEVLMLGLVRHGVPIVTARWLTDGTPLLVGAALGGAVGIATVIFGIALGPLIRFGLRVLRYVPPSKTELLLSTAID
jgi:uncharacterized membrane protein YczE